METTSKFLFEFAWKPQAKPATPLRISSREGEKKSEVVLQGLFWYLPTAGCT